MRASARALSLTEPAGQPHSRVRLGTARPTTSRRLALGLLPPCTLVTSPPPRHLCLACSEAVGPASHPLSALPLLHAGPSASQLLSSPQGSPSSPAQSPLRPCGRVSAAPLQGRVCHFYEIIEELQDPLPCKAALTAPASSLTPLLQGHSPLTFSTDFPSSPPSAPPLK